MGYVLVALICVAVGMSIGMAVRRRATPREEAVSGVAKSSDNLVHNDGLPQRDDANALQPLIHALPDPVFLIDAQERLALVNSAAVKLFGINPPWAVRQAIATTIGEAAVLELCREVRAGRTYIQREIQLVRAGQRLSYKAVAVGDAAGRVLVVLRDVTALEAAAKMKTDFVANASHELRTPVAAIKIALDTLDEVQQDDPVQAAKCVKIIEGHMRRLEEMLRDLLDLSRVENADMRVDAQRVSVGDIFAPVRDTMTPIAAERGVSLEFAGEESATLMTDPRVLNLIVKNLVENALKYTPAGGRVTVTAEKNEAAFMLTVVDTGIGIPQEHLERVFERFYQVDAARTGRENRGTGLGLAIVKHAAGALSGTVKLESKPGEGTVARCEFSVA